MEGVVIEEGSLVIGSIAMGSMEVLRLDVEVMGKTDQVSCLE